jgi:hypothetical protein
MFGGLMKYLHGRKTIVGSDVRESEKWNQKLISEPGQLCGQTDWLWK